MLRKILKISLLLVILLALAALITLIVIYKSWPWWVGAVIGIGLIGIWASLVFFKKFLLRMREKKFVRQIIAQDQAAIDTAAPAERQDLMAVQDKWKKSVALLKNSQIKKHGNPLYVLPWYIVLGESGSGKTCAIQNTKLSSPLTEISRAAGIAGTRDFDWWFFEDSIILDTAGRYSIPVNGERDVEEWETFLSLLARYRKKEPLNGVVVTIPADSLLSQSGETLSDQGQHFRRRIDQLMRTCGARFPVYILVTKTDLVHGMTSFCELFPEEMHRQALGCANEAPAQSWKEFMDNAMKTLVHRFKDMRLLLIQKNKNVDPGVFLFPDEFYRLHDGLNAFAKGIFADNPYQEPPLCRGMFFSSALQEGAPSSEFLRNFDIPAVKNDIRGSRSSGLFLYDFFKRVLPLDRYLFSPITEYIKWRRATTTLGVAAWLLIFGCLAGLVTFSYLCNVSALTSFSREFKGSPEVGADMTNDLLMLNKYRLKIESVTADNRYGWVPRFGLDHSLRAENHLKSAYASLVNREFLAPLDRRLQYQVTDFSDKTTGEKTGAGIAEDMKAGYVNHLVSRIRLLEQYLEQGAFSGMHDLAERASRIFMVINPDMLQEIADKFSGIYISALTWTKEPYLFQSNLKELEITLARMLQSSPTSPESGQSHGNRCCLSWLTNINIPAAKPQRLENYWGWPDDKHLLDGHHIVPAAYTRQGKAYLSEFVDRIARVMESRDPGFEKKTADFWKWYRQQYYKSWADFAGDFPQGQKVLQDRESWQRMGTAMITDDNNPYSRFLSRMAEELTVFEKIPAWARVVRELQQAMTKTPAESKTDPQPGGVFSGMKKKGSRLYQKTLNKTNPQMAEKRQQRLDLTKCWHVYRTSLEDISPALQSRQKAYQLAKGFFPFGKSPEKSNSPFFAAHQKLNRLKQQLHKFGDAAVAIPLAAGPLKFLLDYVTNESALLLQEKWEAMVLGKIQGVSPQRVSRIIFKNPGGVIWDFLDGPAEPFIGRDQNGFYAHRALGQQIPFAPRLFTFMTEGSEALVDVQPSYIVDIRAKPIDFNKNSLVQPFAAFLKLQCADKKTALKNYNYSDFKKFKWSLDTCGDTLVSIFLPDVTLVKKYDGPMGFPKFLRDFRDGVKRFEPADFPDQQTYLKNRGIRWIELSFEIDGEIPVINLLNEFPEEAPEQIVASRY